MPKGKKILFSGVLLALAVLMVGAFVQLALRLRERQVAGSDALDPGLFRHDARLGWELVPDWTGGHRHYDYDVAYRINRLGFRADTGAAKSRPQPLIAVLGDSFTFGFGVADEQTFVHLLDREVRPGGSVVNFAVPGTSTDQQALLLEGRLLKFRPATVLLVVYLGNDLVDNLRAYPAQASNAKPFFELGGDRLVLRNVPVPGESRPVTDAQGTLKRAILGESASEASGTGSNSARIRRFAGRSVVDYRASIEAQLGPSLSLFQAIVSRMSGACEREGVELKLALMAGRSYLEHPDSLSAQYQDMVRSRIVDWAASRGLQVVDLAGAMRARAGSARSGWYFPNDGHLTPEGHQVAAEILLPAIRKK